MFTVFSRSKFKHRRSLKVFSAAMRSPLMISQQDLKKFAVNLFGPGALPEGVRDMAFKISSSVKGAAKASKSKRWTFRTP